MIFNATNKGVKRGVSFKGLDHLMFNTLLSEERKVISTVEESKIIMFPSGIYNKISYNFRTAHYVVSFRHVGATYS